MSIPWDFDSRKRSSVWTVPIFNLSLSNKENLIKTWILQIWIVLIELQLLSSLCGCVHSCVDCDVAMTTDTMSTVCVSGLWSERHRLTWSVFSITGEPGASCHTFTPVNIHNTFISRHKPSWLKYFI